MNRSERRRACELLGGISEERYDDLLRELLEITRGQLVALRQASGGRQQRELAHSICGAAATLGSHAIEKATQRLLEVLDEGSGVVELAEARSALENEVAALERELAPR